MHLETLERAHWALMGGYRPRVSNDNYQMHKIEDCIAHKVTYRGRNLLEARKGAGPT